MLVKTEQARMIWHGGINSSYVVLKVGVVVCVQSTLCFRIVLQFFLQLVICKILSYCSSFRRRHVESLYCRGGVTGTRCPWLNHERCVVSRYAALVSNRARVLSWKRPTIFRTGTFCYRALHHCTIVRLDNVKNRRFSTAFPLFSTIEQDITF